MYPDRALVSSANMSFNVGDESPGQVDACFQKLALKAAASNVCSVRTPA